MMALSLVLWALGVAGWIVAYVLYRRVRTSAPVPDGAITKALLVNRAGLPETLRTLRTAPPKTYARAHGKGIATEYVRTGTAAIYQAQ